MSKTVKTYSARGFVNTVVFATTVALVAGVVAYLSAPEVVTCEGGPSGVSCTLRRSLGGVVAVTWRRLDNVATVATVEYRTGSEDPRERRRSAGTPAHRLRLDAPDGMLLSVHSELQEVDRLRTRIEALVRDPTSGAVRFRLGGTPGVHGWSLAVLAFGLSLVPLWVLGLLFPRLRPGAMPE